MHTSSYRDLLVWQKAVDLATMIYELTQSFPKDERFGLISQMRRCSVSIASNIAEGRYRGTRKDFTQFLRIAYASGAELETQLHISRRLPETQSLDYEKISKSLDEVMRMLNSMIQKLSAPISYKP